MTNYTAEDGLNVLAYLGISDLSEKEREIFTSEWEESYQKSKKGLLPTILYIYSEVSLKDETQVSESPQLAYAQAQLRNADFRDRIRESDLMEKLTSGIPLKDIFATSPWRFARFN